MRKTASGTFKRGRVKVNPAVEMSLDKLSFVHPGEGPDMESRALMLAYKGFMELEEFNVSEVQTKHYKHSLLLRRKLAHTDMGESGKVDGREFRCRVSCYPYDPASGHFWRFQLESPINHETLHILRWDVICNLLEGDYDPNKVRVTRLDAAVDLQVDSRHILFHASGYQKPPRRMEGNNQYHGSPGGDLEICFYDKSKQLGLDSPLTRIEFRKYRKTDLEGIFTEPQFQRAKLYYVPEPKKMVPWHFALFCQVANDHGLRFALRKLPEKERPKMLKRLKERVEWDTEDMVEPFKELAGITVTMLAAMNP